MINLFMALFWLLLGLGLLLIPGFERLQILDTGYSFGWLAIVLAGYNLLRWWLIQQHQRRRRSVHDDEPSRPREYNPEFDFTKDQPDKK